MGLMRGYVHDGIAHREEDAGLERLRKEVTEVVHRRDERHADGVFLHQLADEEVAACTELTRSS